MKKYLFPALALGLVMTSCQSDEPFAPGEGGEKQVTFTLNVPGELGTRAGATNNASDKGGWTNTQGNVSYTLVLSAEGHNQTYKKENVAGNTVTFSPTVVLGREYTVTAYAHFNATAQEDLTNIIETKGINDESKDVYFFTTKENVSKPTINFAEGTSYNFDLKRPYAKLRLIAEDYNTTDDTKPKTNITEVTVSYNNEVYTVFNAVEGEFNTKATKSYTKTWNADYYEQGVASGDKTIFADYIPVNGTDVAPFTIKVKYSGANNEEYERVFAQDIPVRRNALTTLKGAFFTAGAEIKVEVKDEFETPGKNIKFATTAGQLIEAVNAVEDGQVITLSDNIQFSESARTHNSGTWYDGIYYIGDKSFTIDLNGKTISNDGSVNDYLLNFKNAASTNTRSASSKANTITIKNGTIDAGTTAYCALCTSSAQENQLTINLENVKVINNISNGSTIKVRGGVILNVNKGTKIIGKNSYLGIECIASTVNINEGAEIYMNGTSSYNGCLVGVGGNGTINVYGGYGKGVKGGFIAMTSGGTINVSGGEWIANTDGSIGDNSNLYVLTAQSNKYESGFAGPSVINVTDGTFRGGMDAWVLNNAPEEKAELNISGGNFNSDPTRFLDEGYSAKVVDGIYQVMAPVAQVGNTKYATIDDAIANWTNNTTLTLLSDVTLSDVVTLKSTEHHILNLDTYTMTAASGKNAIEVTCNGRSSASYALTINADATNPGGITATGKSCIYYKKSDSTKDRPIIRIYNGVFTGSYSINSTSNGNTNCPQIWIYGGVFNSYMNLTKNLLQVFGGTFHAKINCTGDQNAYRLIAGGRFTSKSWQFMTADAPNKFAVSSKMSKDNSGNWIGTYDVGLYVDKEGYLVVGGPVITEAGDKFEAEPRSYSSWSSYLKYSSAATYGLYYEK